MTINAFTHLGGFIAKNVVDLITFSCEQLMIFCAKRGVNRPFACARKYMECVDRPRDFN
jgi:hypothetical protein